ncbi:MAG: helical backbone metal receptor, partial [Saprospiraceae bacterium]
VGGTKNFKLDMIRELQPDLIIANKEENQKEGIEDLAREFTVYMTEVTDLKTANKAILDIGTLTGKEYEAQDLILSIQEQKRLFSKETLPNNDVLYLIWRKPYMSVGGDTFISEMLEEAGYINALKDKTRYPSLELEDIRNLNPSFIFLSSEPFPFKEKHIEELKEICPGSQVVLVDGEMFSWYGSRLLKAFPYFRVLE